MGVFRHRALLAQFQSNHQNLQALWAMQGNSPGLAAIRYSEKVSGVEFCAHSWNLAMLNRYDGFLALQTTFIEKSLLCDARYIHLAQAAVANDMKIAKIAVESYPHNIFSLKWYAGLLLQNKAYVDAVPVIWQAIKLNPVDEKAWLLLGTALAELPTDETARLALDIDLQSWVNSRKPGYVEAIFTLARVKGMESIGEAELLYRAGLALKPHDGIRWRELGDLLRDSNPQEAIQAYLKSCENGDPGSHGCLRAGLTAEALGDLENAILYLRRSKYSGALEKADKIEFRLMQGSP